MTTSVADSPFLINLLLSERSILYHNLHQKKASAPLLGSKYFPTS